MKAVIDRFEGEVAVLELEDGGLLTVQRSLLPPDAREGAHLNIALDNDKLVGAELDVWAENDAKARIRAKLERLRRGEQRKGRV